MKPHAALLLGLVWLGSAAPGFAQGEPPAEVRLPANGSQLFRALLDYRNVHPAAKNGDRRDKIVIVYGRPHPVDAVNIQGVTRDVLTRGGAVLFLSDKEMDLSARPGRPSSYLPPYMLKAYIISSSVSHPNRNYRGIPECPLVYDELAYNEVQLGRMNAVVNQHNNPFAGFRNIVTNKPGVLLRPVGSPHESRFAKFYNGTLYRDEVRTGLETGYERLFATGQVLADPSQSRWIALADEDVLSNSLLAKGIDNFAFAIQLVDWLRGPEERSECLFFEYGKPVTKLDDVKFVTVPDLPAPPIPPIPPLKVIEEQLTDFGNKVADDAQTNDRLHAALVRDEVGYGRWLRFLAIAAAGVAAVFLLRRAFAARQPGAGPAVAARDDGPPGKLLAVLRQEMVRGNNFTPAVVAYIEETFRLAGLPAGPHAQMPPVAITGKKVKKVELMHDIAALWRVAYGSSGRPVDYAAWRALEPAVEHARRLAVKGRWHFAPDFVPPGAAA
jgi:hypothetical protein